MKPSCLSRGGLSLSKTERVAPACGCGSPRRAPGRRVAGHPTRRPLPSASQEPRTRASKPAPAATVAAGPTAENTLQDGLHRSPSDSRPASLSLNGAVGRPHWSRLRESMVLRPPSRGEDRTATRSSWGIRPRRRPEQGGLPEPGWGRGGQPGGQEAQNKCVGSTSARRRGPAHHTQPVERSEKQSGHPAATERGTNSSAPGTRSTEEAQSARVP